MAADANNLAPGWQIQHCSPRTRRPEPQSGLRDCHCLRY